jgi:hypothetical protein
VTPIAPAPSPDRAGATSFRGRDVLAALYAGCDGLLELRAIRPGATAQQTFCERDDIAAANTFCAQHADADLYFGVATRADATSGEGANCRHLPALFADLDCKGRPLDEARAALAAFALPPSIVIQSGGGLHAYWLLREPTEVQADYDGLRALLRRLAVAVTGDVGAAEPARVLRLPGTRNHKYRPAPRVVVEALDADRQYNPVDFDEFLPVEPAAEQKTRFTVPEHTAPGERNKVLFTQARALKRQGLPRDAILAAMLATNETFNPPHSRAEVERALHSALTQPDRPGHEPRPIVARDYTRDAVTAGLGDPVLLPHPCAPYSGWFARGAVHLVAGSSGAGKTTLMLDLLETQARGDHYLGHRGAGLPFLVAFADRGAVSNTETLARMRIDPAALPIVHLPATTTGAAAVEAIAQAVEARETLPAALFIEGADLLVEDPHKPQIVTPFVVALRALAERYAIAIVLSVGAPKARPNEQYALKRDQVYGSQAWARLSNTVAVLSIAGDGTVATRDLAVLHRNAAAEKFHLAFVEGRLVVSEEAAPTEPNMATWMAEAEVFNRQRFRDAFALSGSRAAELLAGFVRLGVLKEKQKNDRTIYVFQPAAAAKVGWTTRPSVSESDPFSDRNDDPADPPESVRKPVGHGHENAGAPREILSNSDRGRFNPLIPPYFQSVSESALSRDEVSDNGHAFEGYTRAREADDLPACLAELTAPDLSDPIGAHDLEAPAAARLDPWRDIPRPPDSDAAAAAVAARLAAADTRPGRRRRP